MEGEFTLEELKQAIRAARVFNPGFDEQEFQGIVELVERLGAGGYLETITALRKLERGKGVPLSQVLETHEQLIQENERLKQELGELSAEVKALKEHKRAVEKRCKVLVQAARETEARLQQLRQEMKSEETSLATFKKDAAAERGRIDKELAQYRKEADIAEADIAMAKQIKQELAKHGFTLELALGLAAEFAGCADARERLAEGLNRHGKLSNYLAALEPKVKALEEERRRMEGILLGQRKEVSEHEALLSQLEARIAEKSELVGFYQRYSHLKGLVEYLGASDYLTFHHCLWCGALFWVLQPGFIATTVFKCPWCGVALVEPDRNAYAAMSQPPGTRLKLLP